MTRGLIGMELAPIWRQACESKAVVAPADRYHHMLVFEFEAAQQKARCDYCQHVGAGPHNADIVAGLADRSAALKMHLVSTFGELRLDGRALWVPHFRAW